MFAKIILPAATGLNNKTGSWRSGKRPKFLQKNCTGCRMCYLSCPEGCISGSKKTYNADFDYCKGCGICVQICPVSDIIMEDE
ncbi:MAG: 4Fe-4S binding protein [Endomicrobia bacterium]|nr:4Fe-4S binding protein [Endomicrobiia bacterium]MCX7941098.1 4Fe-4S binding protein [Endomicrobiia bacterium]MDW8055244.1 4Fe-4S dicluster-binding protein [Elusimicrobiota bacterium]